MTALYLNSYLFETGILVLLYSQATGLTSVFSFESSAASPSTAISTSDPVLLNLPTEVGLASGGSYDSHKALRAISLVLHRVHHKLRRSQPPSTPRQGSIRQNTEFYQLSLLRSDGSFWECLYAASNERPTSATPVPNIHSREILSQATIASQDGFIIPLSLNRFTDLQIGPSTKQDIPNESKLRSPLDQDLSKTITLLWLVREIDFASVNHRNQPVFVEILKDIDKAIVNRYANDELYMDLLYVQSKVVQLFSKGMLTLSSSGLDWHIPLAPLMISTKCLLIWIISYTI